MNAVLEVSVRSLLIAALIFGAVFTVFGVALGRLWGEIALERENEIKAVPLNRLISTSQEFE